MATKADIRPFQAADLEALQRIRALAFAPVFQSFRQMVGEPIAALAFSRADAEQAELLTSLCDPKSPAQVYVALLDNDIVGFVTVSLNAETRIGEIGPERGASPPCGPRHRDRPLRVCPRPHAAVRDGGCDRGRRRRSEPRAGAARLHEGGIRGGDPKPLDVPPAVARAIEFPENREFNREFHKSAPPAPRSPRICLGKSRL
jgi:hypothetical protein